jgi:hypothetical protein
MTVTSLGRKIFPLLLVAALTAPWGASAEPRRETRPRAAAASPAPFELLSRLWSALTSVWAEEGCHIDPNGRCASNQGSGLTAPADTGCHIDPNGCAASRMRPVD